MSDAPLQDFQSVKQRLEQIADAVNDEAMPLDEALDLFEEAVALGMQISDLLEAGVDEGEPSEGKAVSEEGAPAAADAPSAADVTDINDGRAAVAEIPVE